MNKFLKSILLLLLFSMFFVIRAFQNQLFYDPLINYFKNDYLYTDIFNIDVWRLVKNIFFRYTLNSLLTLGVIWVLFQKKDYFKFVGFFLMFAFMILIISFVFLVRDDFESGYLLPFYIRRFLIHPLFLLLLLPAFYYQKLNKK